MALMTEHDASAALDAQVREANGFLKDGDLERALALLEPLTSDKTVYLPARFLLAMAAWKMDLLDRAVQLMRDCHEKWPMDGTVAEALASLYAQVGDLRESLYMGKLATALGGSGELAVLIPAGFPVFDQVFYNIKAHPLLSEAKASLARGDLGYAIEKARQHSVLNPEDGDAHAFHASLLLRAGVASAAADVLHEVEGSIAGDGEFPAPYASLYARALTAVGEFAEARRWHEKAMDAAPTDANIAAARIADALWLDEKPADLAAAAKDWARRFCPAPKTRQWKRPDGKLVIGYLVSAFADPLDNMAVAAVARAHDRKRVSVVGYGLGEQSWETNAVFAGAFDTWQDIGKLHPATLARFCARDGLHVIVDASGFVAPGCLLALAQLQTAIRVAWLGNPGTLGKPIYDAQIGALSAATTAKNLWRIAGGYPVLRRSQLAARSSRDGIQFGADVGMAQLDRATVELWSAVLRAQPDARLLLRANDMQPGANIDRLVARFGRELAARIDLVNGERTEEFYAKLDVALLPRRAFSARVAAEAVGYGVSPVARAEKGLLQPDATFLRDLGLGPTLVASDDSDYVSIAAGLAIAPPAGRSRMVEGIGAALAAYDDHQFARTIEDHATKALETAEATGS